MAGVDLVLYHTSACHLCELAEEIVRPAAVSAGLVVRLDDIADDDGLLEAYGTRIPVVRHVLTGAELGWPFDTTQMQQFIGACRQQLEKQGSQQ